MSTEIVRVRKHQTPNGTYYVSELRRPRFWGSGFKWVPFIYAKDDLGGVRLREVIKYTFETPDFKTAELATYYCKKYMRIHNDNDVVTIWSKED